MAHKIMLVEDDNNLREIYGARLLAEGYEIVAAQDGEEALALAVKERPDLIISDVMMPKISGFDMLDILRSTAETKDTKVIMMTALSQVEDKARASKLGADKYLVKSQVTLEDVARVVHELLDDGPAAPVPDPAAPTEAAPVVAAAVAAAPAVASASPDPAPADDPTPAPAPVVEPAAPATPPAAVDLDKADSDSAAVSTADEKTEVSDQINQAIANDTSTPTVQAPLEIAAEPTPKSATPKVIEPLAKEGKDINQLLEEETAKLTAAPPTPAPAPVVEPAAPATPPADSTDPSSIAL